MIIGGGVFPYQVTSYTRPLMAHRIFFLVMHDLVFRFLEKLLILVMPIYKNI